MIPICVCVLRAKMFTMRATTLTECRYTKLERSHNSRLVADKINHFRFLIFSMRVENHQRLQSQDIYNNKNIGFKMIQKMSRFLRQC